MKRLALIASLFLAACCLAQQPSSKADKPDTTPSGQGVAAPSSDGQKSNQPSSSQATSTQSKDLSQDSEESSSRDTRIDIKPPKDDAKDHPNSESAVWDLEPPPASDASGVEEFHPWNPMKAMKDVEVGDYYFRRKNYKAAQDRYKEALYYKQNDAVATYRLAVCQEKLGDKAEAKKNFEQYLKILPEGPYAKDARASLDKLATKEGGNR